MAAAVRRGHALTALLVLLQLTCTVSELHRAKHQRPFARASEQTASAPPQPGLVGALSELYARHEPWVLSVVGAALVGFSGILPLLVIPLETGAKLKERGEYPQQPAVPRYTRSTSSTPSYRRSARGTAVPVLPAVPHGTSVLAVPAVPAPAFPR